MQTIADLSLFGADIFMESNKQKLTKVFIIVTVNDPPIVIVFPFCSLLNNASLFD